MQHALSPSSVIVPYQRWHPRLAANPQLAAGAALVGRITAAGDLRLGANAVVRADGHFVEIGDDFWLGPDGTVHIAHDLYPTRIGRGVTAEQGAVIHACEVADGCLLGAASVILDGSQIGPGAVIAPGAIVYPRSRLEGGWLYEGMPAAAVRVVSPGELRDLHASARARLRDARSNAETLPAGDARRPAALFLAASARVSGAVRLGPEVGVWYGCGLHAGDHSISVGARSNIQDNSVILCRDRDVVIGDDTTIGHNVTMTDVEVGARCLIGIGAHIAPGTCVEADVLLAAGAHTEPGQRLSAGGLWAGRPARRVADLDGRKRQMMAGIIPVYREYAAAAHLSQG